MQIALHILSLRALSLNKMSRVLGKNIDFSAARPWTEMELKWYAIVSWQRYSFQGGETHEQKKKATTELCVIVVATAARTKSC